MDVQASSGSFCFCAAAVTAVASVAEAMAAVMDVTVSGSSYSFCAAAATTTVSDASDLSKIKVPGKKGRDSCLFCLEYYLFLVFMRFSRSFCISFFSSDSTNSPARRFRCRQASSSSYTRLPSMINRPMDYLRNRILCFYIICIFLVSCHSLYKKVYAKGFYDGHRLYPYSI